MVQTSTPSQQILQRDLPPLIVVKDRPDIQSVVEDRPSPSHKTHGEKDGVGTDEDPFCTPFHSGLVVIKVKELCDCVSR